MPASASHLHVFLHGTPVGVAVRLRRGAVHLAWDDSSGCVPEDLSQSFHGNARGHLDITDWIDGLLPDNPRTRSRWAQDLQAASAAAFDLLCTRGGLECAGAVQFHPQPALPDTQQDTLVHLTEGEVAHLLRTIIPDAADDTDPLGAPGFGELRLSLGGADAHEFFLGMYANWLIGNTDGHSKNYSVLLHEGVARLAPLYDLSSALPYLAPGTPSRPAMRFAGGAPNSLAEWSVAAERLRIGVVHDELESMAKRLPDALEAAADVCPSWAQPTARDISEQVAARARRVFSESRRADPAVAPVRERETRSSSADGRCICGVIVDSTGDPCLLYRGHHGRHRSKLPGRQS